MPSLLASIPLALNDMGPVWAAKTLLRMNQKDGFDCPSCAWPDPPHRETAEFCGNGAKAVSWEADPLTVPREFWAENPVPEFCAPTTNSIPPPIRSTTGTAECTRAATCSL
ncbi:putative oxidoreductase [Paeniglutamicibacter gangotriensis Lz1y]|uniref:Putative oxidoreductase n=1 Tax=Paeniglutamicibacter gangotriensis Lz1y TaxID=1276920 RepID=M7N8Z2_9MICC|nr:putative oxidoreductase [Paeniglutamicibacter gangotriensis Lz1y]